MQISHLTRPTATGFIALLGLFVLTAVGPSASAQPMDGCIIEDRQLDCLHGEKLKRSARDARYHAALAHPSTAALFVDPVSQLSTFATEWDRELFRRSLERTRYGAMRHMKRQITLHQRGRLNDDEIAAAWDTQAKMLSSYERGYWFYKELGWNRK
jgi:hypothetical protein